MEEFAVNNKTHSVTKVSPFIVNYSRKLRIEVDIRRKRKMEKAMEFPKRIKKIQEEAEVTLKKIQNEINNRQTEEEKKLKNKRKRTE